MKVNGTLGLIACPILEDEIIYCREKDDQVDSVMLIRNDHSVSFERKMRDRGLELQFLNEQEFLRNGVQPPKEGFHWVVWMKDLGLHEEPNDLRKEILDSLEGVDNVFDGILLFYGLCGNALKDIHEWSSERMRTPVDILCSRDGKIVDDCIAAAIGGQDNYLRLLRKYPGILYFTPGYATNWDQLALRMELFRGIEDGDDDMIRMVFEMAEYDTVMKIPTGLGDDGEFDRCTRQFANRYDFNIRTLDKEWCDLDAVDYSYAQAKDRLAQAKRG